MARAGKATPNAGNGTTPTEDSLAAQLMGVAAALWASRQRREVPLLLVALAAAVGATAYAQILLNAWNQPFYGALAHKDISGFIAQLGVFAELAGALLVLNVAQMWLNLKSKLILHN
jgi:putative ATP-binding cassette transporter